MDVPEVGSTLLLHWIPLKNAVFYNNLLKNF